MKKGLRVILPLALTIAPPVIQFLYIRCFSVDVPWWDEWAFVDLLQSWSQQDMGRVIALLWAQHNEHRLLFPRLIMLVLAQLTGWNIRTEMYFSLLLSIMLLVVIRLIYKKTVGDSIWGFVPLAWLIFSLGQWENMLWGWQLALYLQALATICALYLLSARSLRSTALAALCAVVASFSFSSGLLTWPVGLLYLLTQRTEKRRAPWWGLAGLLTIAAYFTGYTSPGHHPSPLTALSHPLETVAFFLGNVGAPLGGGSLLFSRLMGGCLLLLLLIYLYGRLKDAYLGNRQWSDAETLLGSMIIVSLLTSAVIAIARVGFDHPDWAMNSRYITFTSIGITGAYMLFARHRPVASAQVTDVLWPHNFSLLPALMAIILVGLGASNIYGFQQGRALYASRLRAQYILQTYEIQPDEALTALFINPMFVRERAGFLQEQRLSAFREPINLLLLTQSGDSVPAGEILPDRPLVQAFRCPVHTLYDVRIFFATYARSNTATVEITLADSGGVLAQQVLSTADIADNSWVRFTLSTPLENCAGRDLVLTISSPDASPGNAVTVWTYPRYYEGALLEPQEPSLTNRAIGMELNAFFYGLCQVQ
ncbi:MAG: hypothetical protein ACUVR2_12630 [Anaerolineae bacterium]